MAIRMRNVKLRGMKARAKDKRPARMDKGKAVTGLPCGVDGCTRIAERKDICDIHRRQGYTDQCSEKGCEEPARAKGKCRNHYQKAWRLEMGETKETHDWPAKRTNPVSTKVSDACLEILKAGGAKKGTTAAIVLEEWAELQRRHTG